MTTTPHSPPPPRLSVRQLQSRFAGPFTFDLHAGECLALRGPSGSGKSVLLRMLADLDPHQGEALLDGIPCEAMPAPQWRRQVLYQSAEPAWWEATAAEHFAPDRLEKARHILSELAMNDALLDTDVSRLSTGERQRMALARSLAAGPRVLLLDEPTASLDPDSVLAVERVLRGELARGTALLLVTHSEEQAQRLASRVMRMERGGFSA